MFNGPIRVTPHNIICAYLPWPMHGIGVGMLEVVLGRHVCLFTGIKTPNSSPSPYSVETQDITYVLSLSLY